MPMLPSRPQEYTSLQEQNRQNALIQQLRQDKKYARNPFGALAQVLNAKNAKDMSAEEDERDAANQQIETEELNDLLARSASGYDVGDTDGDAVNDTHLSTLQKRAMVDRLRQSDGDSLVESMDPLKPEPYQSPMAQGLALKGQMAENLAEKKARHDSNNKRSNSITWAKAPGPDGKLGTKDDVWKALQSSSGGGALVEAETPEGMELTRPMYETDAQFNLKHAGQSGTNVANRESIPLDSEATTAAAVIAAPEEARIAALKKQMESTGGETGTRNVKEYDTAQSAVANVSKIDNLITHLDSSEAITGIGADMIKNIERIKVFMGGKNTKVKDTELLDIMMGSEVFPLIKSLGLGARGMDTPAEREFMRSVLTGQISLNKDTLKKMAGMRRDIAQRLVDKWNKRIDDGELDDFYTASGMKKQRLGESSGSDASNMSDAALKKSLGL